MIDRYQIVDGQIRDTANNALMPSLWTLLSPAQYCAMLNRNARQQAEGDGKARRMSPRDCARLAIAQRRGKA